MRLPGPTRNGATLSLLIVDDDKTDTLFVRKTLLRAWPDAHVTSTTTFEDGLTQIQSKQYDAALVDYRLGCKSGLDLITICRRTDLLTPLILMTGQGNMSVDVDALAAGASDYIEKAEITTALLERAIRYGMAHSLATRQLLAVKQRFEAVVAGTQDGIWDWNLQTDEFFLSATFKEMLGLHPERPANMEAWLACIDEEHRDPVEREIRARARGQSTPLSVEYRVRNTNPPRWMLIRGRLQQNDQGHGIRLAGSQTDISERKAAAAEVEHRALHDALTGLANRALLRERLSHALERVRREDAYAFAVLFIDLDGFKMINDRFGHDTGDVVLVEVAKRIRNALRAVDCVARLGGDEFVVLLDQCNRDEDARLVAEVVEDAIAAPLGLPEQVVSVGASIGVHRVSHQKTTVDDLLAAADRSMYRQKQTRPDRSPHLTATGTGPPAMRPTRRRF